MLDNLSKNCKQKTGRAAMPETEGRVNVQRKIDKKIE